MSSSYILQNSHDLRLTGTTTMTTGMTSQPSEMKPTDSTTTGGDRACHQALNTAELLEMILLEVDDMQTVLLAQRVSRTFKSAIEGSKSLQKKLWFLPDPEYTDEHSTVVEGCSDTCFICGSIAPPPLSFNPLVAALPFWKLSTHRYGRIDITLKDHSIGDGGEESWRRMFLVNSPSQDVGVFVRIDSKPDSDYAFYMPANIIAGDVLL